MSGNSSIEWTSATWNPVVGCTRASAGCDNCYAVTMTNRLEAMGQQRYAGLTVLNGKGDRHFNGVVRTVPEVLEVPLRWKKPRRIFVNSMSDLFHRDVPFEFIDRVFAVMALCPQHTFQILTKRPERMAEYLDGPNYEKHGSGRPHLILREAYRWATDHPRSRGAYSDLHAKYHADYAQSGCWPLPNVWLGTSCENQAAADERIPHLLRCPAAVRFLSCEPLIGPIDIPTAIGCGTRDEFDAAEFRKLGWVIVGGESGPGARPCNVAWIRSIVEQCKAADVPWFVKQFGANVRWNGIQGGYMDGPSNCWPPRTKHDNDVAGEFRMKLNDTKGGDMAEWPEDLRVREFPKAQVPA